MSEISRSPLCWPNNVPRRSSRERGYPQFYNRTITQAAQFVIAEINRINKRRWDHVDESVIISTNLRLNQNGLPSSNQPEPADTGVAVYFQLRFTRNGKWYERHCVLTCDRWLKLSDNLWAIGKDIEAQRARERWGSTTTEQAFQGYLAIHDKTGAPSWWTRMGVTSSATREEIEQAYRTKSKKAHPDTGGSHHEFSDLQEAYEQAMAQFR